MKCSQIGATLIELIVAIVIISAAGGTLVALLATMSRNSAEAMVQSQSIFIANAYLTEILSRSFTNPSNPNGQSAHRWTAESVDDYPSCLPDNLVRDRNGNLIASFQDYRIGVTITQPGFPNPSNIVPSSQTRLVQIAVTSPYGDVTRLAGFKTSH